MVNKFTYGLEKPSRSGMRGETRFWLLKLTGNEVFSSWNKIVDRGWFSPEEIIEKLAFPDEKNEFQNAIKQL